MNATISEWQQLAAEQEKITAELQRLEKKGNYWDLREQIETLKKRSEEEHQHYEQKIRPLKSTLMQIEDQQRTLWMNLYGAYKQDRSEEKKQQLLDFSHSINDFRYITLLEIDEHREDFNRKLNGAYYDEINLSEGNNKLTGVSSRLINGAMKALRQDCDYHGCFLKIEHKKTGDSYKGDISASIFGKKVIVAVPIKNEYYGGLFGADRRKFTQEIFVGIWSEGLYSSGYDNLEQLLLFPEDQKSSPELNALAFILKKEIHHRRYEQYLQESSKRQRTDCDADD